MTHTAIVTYRAILAAAESAPTPGGDGDHGRVRIPTSDTGHMMLQRDAASLQRWAEIVRKNWALYGGGPKPAEIARPARRVGASWSPTAVQVWREQIEAGQLADATRLGLEKLGARFYVWRAAFCMAAPKPVEGLAPEFASGRRDDGKWLVFDLVSGCSIGRGFPTRAAAEKDARRQWAIRSEEQRAHALQVARHENKHSQAQALAAWCEAYGIDSADIPAALPDVDAPADAPADAAPAVPVAQPAEEIAAPAEASAPPADAEAAQSAPDAPGLLAELDAITAAARHRMGGRCGPELHAMTDAERARRHEIMQALPSFAAEREAARARVAARVAARRGVAAGLSASAVAPRPAAGLPHSALAGLGASAPGTLYSDIGTHQRSGPTPPYGGICTGAWPGILPLTNPNSLHHQGAKSCRNTQPIGARPLSSPTASNFLHSSFRAIRCRATSTSTGSQSPTSAPRTGLTPSCSATAPKTTQRRSSRLGTPSTWRGAARGMPSWMNSSPRRQPRMPTAAGSATRLAGRDRCGPGRTPPALHRISQAERPPPLVATSAQILGAPQRPAACAPGAH